MLLLSEGRIRTGLYVRVSPEGPHWQLAGTFRRVEPTHWTPIPIDLLAGAAMAERELQENRIVWTTRTMMSEEGRAFYTLHIRPLVKQLEAAVLLAPGGLQDQNRGRAERGMAQEEPPRRESSPRPKDWVEILSYTMAGRIMVTLRRDTVVMSVVFDETSKESTAGLQGILGTFGDMRCLVEDAIRQWKAHPVLVPDEDVGILGIGKIGQKDAGT